MVGRGALDVTSWEEKKQGLEQSLCAYFGNYGRRKIKEFFEDSELADQAILWFFFYIV